MLKKHDLYARKEGPDIPLQIDDFIRANHRLKPASRSMFLPPQTVGTPFLLGLGELDS
jgi:hypothetical protein